MAVLFCVWLTQEKIRGFYMNIIVHIVLGAVLLAATGEPLFPTKAGLLPVKREQASDGNPTFDPAKPFVCPWQEAGIPCAHRASTCDLIRRHYRSKHSGERPFKCGYCEQVFTVSWCCAEHERRHTGEKPYKCDWCDKSFVKRGLLVKHVLTHTGEKPYTCTLCGFTCSQQPNVLAHMKRVHPDDEPGFIYTPPVLRPAPLAACRTKAAKAAKAAAQQLVMSEKGSSNGDEASCQEDEALMPAALRRGTSFRPAKNSPQQPAVVTNPATAQTSACVTGHEDWDPFNIQ